MSFILWPKLKHVLKHLQSYLLGNTHYLAILINILSNPKMHSQHAFELKIMPSTLRNLVRRTGTLCYATVFIPRNDAFINWWAGLLGSRIKMSDVPNDNNDIFMDHLLWKPSRDVHCGIEMVFVTALTTNLPPEDNL